MDGFRWEASQNIWIARSLNSTFLLPHCHVDLWVQRPAMILHVKKYLIFLIVVFLFRGKRQFSREKMFCLWHKSMMFAKKSPIFLILSSTWFHPINCTKFTAGFKIEKWFNINCVLRPMFGKNLRKIKTSNARDS